MNSANPAQVISREPRTWVSRCTPSQPSAPRCSRWNASAEKVEKVVRPPNSPVVSSNFRADDIAGQACTAASATPISRPPTRLAARVPSGTKANTGFSHSPSPQRSQAPHAAPTPTAANAARFIPTAPSSSVRTYAPRGIRLTCGF
ncbi:protein CrcB CrcB [Thauera sp. 28]|nr:protein CrcB CrcB [Thauera sp. 28]